MKTITKEHYLGILLEQLNYLNNKEGVHPQDIETLVNAYEDAKQASFTEVEVIAPQHDGDGWKFLPITVE
ncbi:hypothetical protein TW81_09905 [Vibrio galatheae]|uniref:Uncharacterized protein n=1 Tax=Vibrio galatheae TaxID=579748 RepID=A0A0F4NJD6_9VIBR|nr:hypothetical protein [Vibrio galatheae]KJY83300.1 hypothetical protein TW81_09905 [Vibrio galatheae]